MSKLQNEGINQIIDYINKNHYEYLYFIFIGIILFFTGITWLITWLITSRKGNAEIQKLKTEIQKLKVDNTKETQQASKLYNTKVQELENLLQNTIASLKLCNQHNTKSNAEKLRKDWKKLTSFYFNEFVNSFDNYIQIKECSCDKKQKKHIINHEIFRFLKTTVGFYETINNPNILSIINNSRFDFSIETFVYHIQFVKTNTSFINIKIRKKLYESLQTLELTTPSNNFLKDSYNIYLIKYIL
ncbi:hypothetical protein CN283_29740 [Bacillus thuringiensis]|uniref:hypothetical protein n=1 Tax=Bacillus thuringiensis TaxID=1428 RepID=UPI000BF5A7D6|nr:hypothetical protein [Bacillus thuringiensis]PFB77489.1 hypothetical protein CN283_29740 [Bacillus thuringiensis]